jgi:hypothetical protein
MKKLNIPKPLRLLLLHLVALSVLLLVLFALSRTFSTPCPLKIITTIPCPFCGMTRAHLEALGGNFDKAFKIHPLFPLGIPYLLLVIHIGSIPKKFSRVANVVAVISTVLLFALYVYRLIAEGIHFI